MRIDVVSLFPDYLAPLRLSLPGRAQDTGLIDVHVHDLRDWTHDRHRTVDDTPYGGGAGMVLRPEPWGEALDTLLADPAGDDSGRTVLVVPTPAGERLTQRVAADLARADRLVFACGRYEGIDQRVLDHAATRVEVLEVSIGDYVLNGGEVAALVVTEAVVRLLPGFMGNPESLTEESHGGSGLLEHPVYTKPATWRGLAVPDVLLSGDHARITAWRLEQSQRRTAERRPDLLAPSSIPGIPGTTGPTGATGGALEVRAAVLADAPEILVLQLACWVAEAHANATLDIPPLHDDVDDVRRWLGEWTTTVVRSGSRLVGAVRGRRDPEDASGWEVGRLMVAPDLRGRGLGRWLLEHIEAAAPEGTRRTSLFTGSASTRNLRMYKRAGYRPDRRAPVRPGVVHLSKPRGRR